MHLSEILGPSLTSPIPRIEPVSIRIELSLHPGSINTCKRVRGAWETQTDTDLSEILF